MVSKTVTFGSTRIVADSFGGFVQVVVQCFHYRPGTDPATTVVVEYSMLLRLEEFLQAEMLHRDIVSSD
jgi:hypothetical protein